jgi:hypothetical protein
LARLSRTLFLDQLAAVMSAGVFLENTFELTHPILPRRKVFEGLADGSLTI